MWFHSTRKLQRTKINEVTVIFPNELGKTVVKAKQMIHAE